MAWPDSTSIWGNTLSGVQADIALIARTIAKYEPVVMCADSGAAAQARQLCGSTVTVITTIPVGDCWMRDSGPVFRTDGAGGLDAIGLNFNGWATSRPTPRTHSSPDASPRTWACPSRTRTWSVRAGPSSRTAPAPSWPPAAAS
ncbi:hypothetical protein EAO70_25815 [Streptomyces sp. adm13(2018)]|nr:hypothetical protein EAO70_25815 [Streptomyces sp. adm13(2018)]